MTMTPPDAQTRRAHAIQRCQSLIKWYTRAKLTYWWAYLTLQIATVVLSGLTPVLILLDGLSKPLQALPAALAAAAAALNGIFQFQQNYVIFTYAQRALESELTKFETRTTGDYSVELEDQRALDNFVSHVEAVVMNATSEWRAQALHRDFKQTGPAEQAIG